MLKSKLVCLVYLILTSYISAQTGEIRGKVIDTDNLQPLIGVNIIVIGTEFGSSTNKDGNYKIDKLPAGMYSVEYSYIGYKKRTVTDIFVRPQKTTFVNTGLKTNPIYQDEIIVSSGYFDVQETSPVSVQALNYEEIRRSPGARGDVSRMVQNLPGVNFTSDDRNDLVIRGGSPTEVLFYVDNHEIPNPNHFGTQGSTGGPISLINTEFVNKLNFYSGGFNSSFGNKLSGVLDIKLREGNRNHFSGKVDLSIAGAGGFIEGPIDKSKGSYYVSAQRSYLELLEGILDYGGIPVYSNVQGKLVYDLSTRHQISLLFLGADDNIDIDHEIELDDYKINILDTVEYFDTKFKSRQLTGGLNLRSIWSKNFYTNLTASYSYYYFDMKNYSSDIEGVHQKGNDKLRNENKLNSHLSFKNRSTEQISTLKWNGNISLNNSASITFGSYLKNSSFNHKIEFSPANSEKLDQYGNPPLPFKVNDKFKNKLKFGGFMNISKTFFSTVTLNLGLRADHFRLINNTSLSPRINLIFKPVEWFSIYGAIGRYYQNPEFIWLTSNETNLNSIKDLGSDHFVTGITLLPTTSTKISIEGYVKKYFDYPVSGDEGYSMISLANTGADYGSNSIAKKIISEGTGKSSGIDFNLHQVLVSNFYSNISYSYSNTKHKALDGILRRGAFDNRHVFNFIFGYRFNDAYEFSIKWRYASGRPYTPYDINASKAAGEGRLDLQNINSETYDDYSRFDIRLDHREYFSFGTVVEYISIENVFDRKNVLSKRWNAAQGTTSFNHQIGRFIVAGINLEF